MRRQLRQGTQAADFVEEAGIEHRIEALFDALVQHCALRRRQRELQDLERETRALGVALPVADRLAAEAIHLQRPLDALRIGGVDARRGVGIDCGKLRMQCRPTMHIRFGRDLRAHRFVRFRHVRQAFQQRTEIQAGAAGKNRQLALRDDAVDGALRIRRELRRRIRLPRFAHVDQVVRHQRQFLAGRLGRADVEAAIDQRRIDADDLALQPLRQLERIRALARRGRAHQGDGARARIQAQASRPFASRLLRRA